MDRVINELGGEFFYCRNVYHPPRGTVKRTLTGQVDTPTTRKDNSEHLPKIDRVNGEQRSLLTPLRLAASAIAVVCARAARCRLLINMPSWMRNTPACRP